MTNGWAKWGIRLEIDFGQGSFNVIAGSVNWRSRIQEFAAVWLESERRLAQRFGRDAVAVAAQCVELDGRHFLFPTFQLSAFVGHIEVDIAGELRLQAVSVKAVWRVFGENVVMC